MIYAVRGRNRDNPGSEAYQQYLETKRGLVGELEQKWTTFQESEKSLLEASKLSGAKRKAIMLEAFKRMVEIEVEVKDICTRHRDIADKYLVDNPFDCEIGVEHAKHMVMSYLLKCGAACSALKQRFKFLTD